MHTSESISRRTLLAGIIAAGVTLLAGCGGPGEDADGETDDDPNEGEGEDGEGEADDDDDNDSINPPASAPA